MTFISDLRFKISDWTDVRRTLVCRAWKSQTAIPQGLFWTTRDKLKFVGHLANLKSEILNLKSVYAPA